MAAAAFLIGFVLIAMLGPHVITDPVSRYIWAVACATMMGSLTGTLILPLQNRKTACYVFVCAPVILSVILLLVSLFGSGFNMTFLLNIAGSLMGGLFVLQAVKRQFGK